VLTSSFIPGSDWGYPLYYIYEACNKDYDSSALFFGLLMWVAVMKNSNDWSFMKYDEKNIKGMTYFRITI